MDRAIRNIFFIGLSIIVAMMLTVLPLPAWIQWLRPLWVPLVIFYWALAVPQCISVGIAWSVGLVMDVLLGLPLGEQALLLTLATYVVSKFHQRIRLFSRWQQTAIIFVLTVLYFGLQFWLQVLLREPPSVTWKFWLPTITTAALWPWVFVVLRDYRRRYGIE